MRLFLCFLFFGVLITSISAQTLEFSTVRLVGTNAETVPAGKVWKVVKAIPAQTITRSTSTSYSTPSTSNVFACLINGQTVPLTRVDAGVTTGRTGSSSSQSAVYQNLNTDMFPFWLPTGTTLEASTGLFYLSVIEFTVVP